MLTPSGSPLLTWCEALAEGYEHGGKPRSHRPWSSPTSLSRSISRSRGLGTRLSELFVGENLGRVPVVHRCHSRLVEVINTMQPLDDFRRLSALSLAWGGRHAVT